MTTPAPDASTHDPAEPPARPKARRNLFASQADAEPAPRIARLPLDLDVSVEGRSDGMHVEMPKVRGAELLAERPPARPLPLKALEVTTEGWRFPDPLSELQPPTLPAPRAAAPEPVSSAASGSSPPENAPTDADQGFLVCVGPGDGTRLTPPADTILLRERLLVLLQPPLENLFVGRKLHLPFKPFQYQMEGIAFLMPRSGALLADEMGLGKTMQTIVALRLLLHTGMINRALLVCPKPLVTNWSRELRTWADDVPFEVIAGSNQQRRAAWLVSNAPLKVVNYEVLTRDAELLKDERCQFDLVVLDEAQRIKNKGSKTADVVNSLQRRRSWALTGTPIENRPEDLINLMAFVKPGQVPEETPPKQLGELTKDFILRRVKEDVLTDMPPKMVRDAYLDLTAEQKETYRLAEEEGIVHLNELGDTITVQHVFELVMRLKQICNFDPRTGQSAKLDQLLADMAEVAASERKAIVFSQWVEPLERLARHLSDFGPLLFHGKVPSAERQAILDEFKNNPRKHVILMSYGTGSVGLNLQFANYVFLYDRWWNPAIEDQAINRAHRIGQKEPVFVTRFIAQNTIEERICEVLARKRQLFEEVIGQQDGPVSMGLNESEIFGLFNLQVRPRRHAA